MPEPVDFPESTLELKAPHGMEGCGSLPVFTDGQKCISCWELTDADLERLQDSRQVWIWVYSGQTQPPIAVDTQVPFRRATDSQDGEPGTADPDGSAPNPDATEPGEKGDPPNESAPPAGEIQTSE